MFDLGWSEMAVIMLVALIVIGPKDLPKVARTIGQWTGKARALARDFQRSLDDMAREAELDEIKQSISKAGRTDFKRAIKDAIDPEDELEAAFEVNDEKAAKRTPGKPAPAKAKPTGASAKPKALPPVAGDGARVGEATSAESKAAVRVEGAPEARG